MIEKLPVSYSLYRLLWQGIDLLYPPDCGGCEKKWVRWCDDCKQSVVEIDEPFCDKCGLPQAKSGVCEKCLKTPPAYQQLRSWVAFDGAVRNALHRVKYDSDFGMGEMLAAEMLSYVNRLAWDVDLIIPVPLGKQRYRERGYNQAASFARPLSLAKGWRYAPNALRRVKETKSQVELSSVERMKNVEDAFVAESRDVGGKVVLVLDDVSTTGATLNSCANALIRGGAKAVYGLTIARALPQHGLRTV